MRQARGGRGQPRIQALDLSGDEAVDAFRRIVERLHGTFEQGRRPRQSTCQSGNVIAPLFHQARHASNEASFVVDDLGQ